GASGHEDGRQQHGELPQEGEGNQVDGVDGGAEVRQYGGTQKGDDRPDHEGEQGHDADGVERNLLDLGDHRGHPPGTGAQQAAHQTSQRQADEAQQVDYMAIEAEGALADIAQQLEQCAVARRALILALQAVRDPPQQNAAFFRQAGMFIGQGLDALAAEQFGKQLAAGGIQAAELTEIGLPVVTAFLAQLADQLAQLGVVLQDPVALDDQ